MVKVAGQQLRETVNTWSLFCGCIENILYWHSIQLTSCHWVPGAREPTITMGTYKACMLPGTQLIVVLLVCYPSDALGQEKAMKHNSSTLDCVYRPCGQKLLFSSMIEIGINHFLQLDNVFDG